MKKILYLLPIIFICIGCSKTPTEQTYENNNELISLPQENIQASPDNTTSIEIKTTEEPTVQETVKPEPTPSPKVTTTIKSPEPSPTIELQTGNEVGNIVLDFSAKNLENTHINLSDYRGKTVFLNFWASWCGPCVRELPYIQKIHQTYDDVVVLTVNCGDSASDIKDFMAKNNYTFNVIPDESGTISYLYYTEYIPLTLVIDENGIITERHVGTLTENEMLNLINKGENE